MVKPKIERKRSLLFLKILAVPVVIVLIAYIFLSIFAPHLQRRFESTVRNVLVGPERRSFAIAAAEKGGHYYRLSRLIKTEMEKKHNRSVAVMETGGSLHNLELLRDGSVDFALVQGGLPENDKINLNGLSAVAAVAWQYVHLVVPNDSSIHCFKDIAGKKVGLGVEKSGNAALGRMVLSYFPSSAGVQPVYCPLKSINKDFASGKIDVLFATYDLKAPLIDDLMNSERCRLVPINEAEAVAYNIPGCFPATIPHSLYGPKRDIPIPAAHPFYTLKVKTLLVTRNDMNDFLVRDLLNLLYSREFIKQSGLSELNEESGRKISDMVLHKAADSYYRRNDPVTADKYEIGSAFIAALVFIAGVFSFFINRYRARLLEKKKKNIVPYFEELLQYSQKISESKDIEELQKLLDGMMAMQRRAEKEWLAGRLDTEHMENLYAIYGIRCDNAFNKMTLLQLMKNEGRNP